MTSVMVVSEEELPRSSLKHLLLSERDFSIAGVHSMRSAARMIKKNTPDVVLVHSTGPTKAVEQFVLSTLSTVPGTRILVIARAPSDRELQGVFAAGATGFLLFKASPSELFDAIRSVAAGERVIDPGLTSQLITLALKEEPRKSKQLSAREQQVLRLMAYGHTVKEIATKLSISDKSVETYLARLREKLHLRTRAEIVRHAYQLGFFSDDPSRKRP